MGGLSHRCAPLLAGAALAIQCSAQPWSASWVDSVAAKLAGNTIDDYESTLPLARQLFAYYSSHTDTCGMAEASVAMGSCYDAVGKLDSALYVLLRAGAWPHTTCGEDLPDRIALNLSSVYISLNEFDRVDSICAQAVDRMGERTSSYRGDLMFNRAVALANQGDLHGADLQFAQLQELARTNDDAISEIDALVNRGALRGMQNDHEGAERHLKAALSRCAEVDCPMRAVILHNLASVAGGQKRYADALALMESALALVTANGDLQLQSTIIHDQAQTAYVMGDFERAWELQQRFVILRDSLLDVEKVRAISDVREKYQTEKRMRQIKELEVEKLDAALRQARLRRTRNIYLFSGIGVVMLSAGLWSRLRFVHRSRAAIRREKEISEGLLHNILPEEVAQELKDKGEAEARLIDQVTVLFTDFKGFTAMSEQLSPKELVRDIHECFSAFDRIAERHGIEKIKTIGDAYMAAGGLPIPNSTHATDVVQAALEMRDFIEQGKARKRAAGQPYFEIRIGVHTGPVVAGIVGLKKFQYDIWGDTVNTASRMESSGEPGRVNISEATYQLIVSSPLSVVGEAGPDGQLTTNNRQLFTFTRRGKVQAKGKGEMEMYFVERTS